MKGFIKEPKANSALRRAREERGWTREDVAARLGTNGFTVYRWESGRAFPGPYYRRQLCTLFGCELADLGLSRAATSRVARQLVAVPATQQLPGKPFAGREALCEQLRSMLCEESLPADVALYGLPGVGKTALACSLVRDDRLRTAFPDGVLWVSAGQSPALGQILPTLDTQGRVLLICDDLWECASAQALKAASVTATHLFITRSPRLAARLAPHRILHVPELDPDSALALLQRLAPEAVAFDPERAAALVECVGGLPLALALMGYYLYEESLSGQPRRIEAALSALQEPATWFELELPGSCLPQTLRQTIARSTARLAPEAWALLKSLVVFPARPATFTEEAAACVSQLDKAAFVSTLDTLCDLGLVEGCTARYSLHAVIRTYARLEGEEPGCAPQTREAELEPACPPQWKQAPRLVGSQPGRRLPRRWPPPPCWDDPPGSSSPCSRTTVAEDGDLIDRA